MLLNLFELASNKTLQHDPQTQARLVKLQGKTMVLNVKTINQSFSVTPRPEGLEFSNSVPDNVDVTLKATIGAMVKITRDGIEDAELEQGELEIIGDPIIGQRFALVISELDIDWHSLLAEHVGDGPAQLFTSAAEQAKGFAQDSQTQFKGWLNRFITEEMNIVAGKQEVEEFLDQVDTLRADTDRLVARVKRLTDKK